MAPFCDSFCAALMRIVPLEIVVGVVFVRDKAEREGQRGGLQKHSNLTNGLLITYSSPFFAIPRERERSLAGEGGGRDCRCIAYT